MVVLNHVHLMVVPQSLMKCSADRNRFFLNLLRDLLSSWLTHVAEGPESG